MGTSQARQQVSNPLLPWLPSHWQPEVDCFQRWGFHQAVIANSLTPSPHCMNWTCFLTAEAATAP